MKNCPFCGEPIYSKAVGNYRAIPGNHEQPADWARCHISCAREQQEEGLGITVRWPIAKEIGIA